MNKFDCVRIFDEDVETHSSYQHKNRIEFVVNKSKFQQVITRVFGSLYNIGRSRYNDGLMVYCPQDYRDFLTFLQEMKVEDKQINVFKMVNGAQQFLSNNRVTFYEHKKVKNGVKFLIKCAAEYLKDASLSFEENEEKKAKFIVKCSEVLENMGINADSETEKSL